MPGGDGDYPRRVSRRGSVYAPGASYWIFHRSAVNGTARSGTLALSGSDGNCGRPGGCLQGCWCAACESLGIIAALLVGFAQSQGNAGVAIALESVARPQSR